MILSNLRTQFSIITEWERRRYNLPASCTMYITLNVIFLNKLWRLFSEQNLIMHNLCSSPIYWTAKTQNGSLSSIQWPTLNRWPWQVQVLTHTFTISQDSASSRCSWCLLLLTTWLLPRLSTANPSLLGSQETRTAWRMICQTGDCCWELSEMETKPGRRLRKIRRMDVKISIYWTIVLI